MSVDTQLRNTYHFGDKQPVVTRYDSVIGELHSTLKEELRQLFEGMVRIATARLVAMDSDANSNETSINESNETLEKKALERESIRYFLRDSKIIGSRYFNHIIEQLKPGKLKPDAYDTDELSLVNHDEMVAITTINANALNYFGEAISDLNARIEYLESRNAPIFSSEAISPKAFCETYRKTLNQLNIRTNVNLVLLKLFDEQVNKKLESLYSSLNKIFIDADIMPEVAHTSDIYETPEEEGTYSSETVDYCDDKDIDEQKPVNTDFTPHSQEELYDIVSQFIRGDISVTGKELELPASKLPASNSITSESPIPQLPASFFKDPRQQHTNSNLYYQRKDVVRSLNRLQERLLDQDSKSELNNSEEIKRSLIDEIGVTNEDGTAKEISVLDERNIDFVGLMFNAIAEDHSMSEAVNNLVSLLHIPVIKVALDDEQLFQDKAHPTRKVLNLIPKAGKGVTDTKDRLYKKIEHVVKNILAEDVDVKSFYRAVDTLYKIIHLEEETAYHNEKEEQRNVIKEHARNVVVTELRKFTAGRVVPKVVQPLVLKNLSSLMHTCYVKHGAESIEWSYATRLCKLLIDLLQPVNNKSQWETFNNNYNALADIVHDELYDTKQDRINIDVRILNLKGVFIKMAREYKHFEKKKDENIKPAIPYAVQKQMDEYDAEIARIKQQEESVVDKVARLPVYVKPGTWFELYNGEDLPATRLKMSVILLETAEIVFVDHKGIKGMAKDAGIFAEELASDKSRIIEEHAAFDKALGKVISMIAA